MASIRSLSIVAVLAALFLPIYTYLEKNLESFYIFDHKDLHDLANRAIAQHGNDTRGIVSYITTELSGRDHLTSFVNLDEEWVFNNAGGAMGAMYIIHASITEYLIIFGTAIGTEGHSGRHTADDYFNILTGTQLAYVPGEYEPEVRLKEASAGRAANGDNQVYPAGSVHHLRRGEVKQYKMDSSCFAMEYARGWIPPMLFFGYADTFSSTLDFPTLWATTRITGREMIANLLKFKL
ncbi:C-8 sterol isomerase [Diplodia intermedia]|uniref:C-8 sterol isomerase n=1 Tax=Diplodia intermedia TaxID=856260 RepID=A0ABR3U0P8_9PEZI